MATQLSLFGPGVANRNQVYDLVQPTHSKAQLQVLELLRSQPNGVTIDEAAKLMGKTPNQISGRFSELRRAGLIENRGNEKRLTSTGHTACVWFAHGETGKR